MKWPLRKSQKSSLRLRVRRLQLIAFALSIILSFAPTLVRADILISLDDREKNIIEALSVLKVTGRLAGTGTIILYDRKPAILTNSHVLQGMTSAELTFPTMTSEAQWNGAATMRPYSRVFDTANPAINHAELRIAQLKKHFRVKVLFDSPAADVAVLEVPSNLDDDTFHYFNKAALLNGRFCSGQVAGCVFKQDIQSANHKAVVNAVPNLQWLSVPMLSPFSAGLVPDTFISGADENVIQIPIYLRPGSSGGAFYLAGKFTGLVTRVSSAGEPLAIAITIQGIEKALSSPARGRWVSTSAGYQLQVNDGDDVLQNDIRGGGFQPGGGATSNGGGATSNGAGGATSNGAGNKSENPYWKLEVRDSSTASLPGTYVGLKTEETVNVTLLSEVQTLNPFTLKSQGFTLNGTSVAMLGAHWKLLTPSAATYLWYKHHQPETIKVIESDAKAIAQLRELQNRHITPFRFARLYEKREGALWLKNLNCDTIASDRAQALFAQYDATPQGNSHKPECRQRKTSSQISSDGFNHGEPFSSRQQTGFSLDSKFRARVETEILLARDFSNLRVRRGADEKVLHPIASSDPSSQIYRSEDNTYRAVAIYNADNLVELDRLFVEGPEFVSEFLTCTPGTPGCVR